jgi:hypothetical protein
MGNGSSFLGAKQQGRESDHSFPCSAEVRNGGATPSLPHTSLWHGVSSVKYRDNFTFTFRVFTIGSNKNTDSRKDSTS